MTRESQTVPPFPYAPILLLALGTFAVGTEGFMIAAILPGIAADLGVSVPGGGAARDRLRADLRAQLAGLTALTGGVDRRLLLILSMAAFTAANLVAAWPGLLGAGRGARAAGGRGRALCAECQCAGRGIAPPRAAWSGAGHRYRRDQPGGGAGRAAGCIVGTHFGWRMTFLGVAALAAIAGTGLLVGPAARLGAGLRRRAWASGFAVMRRPAVLVALR